MKLPALQHAGRIELTALSHCGRYLFVSTADQGWLLSWPAGKLLTTVKIAPLFDAVFKEDGMLALCGARTVTMVGLPHLERRPSAKKVSGTAVPKAAWLDGDRLVAASLTNPSRALLLDFMGNRLATLAAPGDLVTGVAASGRYIAVYGDALTIWDDTTLEPVGTHVLHAWAPGTGWPTRFHHNGKRLASPTPTVFGLAFTPSAERLVSAGSDGNLALWDTKTVMPLDTFSFAPFDPRGIVVPSEDVAYVVATTGLYRLTLDPFQIDRVAPLERRSFRWNTPIGLSMSADRTTLVFGGRVGEIGVWDLAQDPLLR